jgi:DNA (cytosine-5)-methyltransferase 1
MKYNYDWTLKDAVFTKDKGKVFSCFACGGGSTMGYKLAGFDVIGCNEIDPKMMAAYIANHNPKYSFLEPIQTFKDRDDLPEELYNLDILDGSPPCSSFSTVGNREEDWGKKKKFREGQADQVLDTLFFDFIEFGKKLQPKIIVAENVKGLLLGNARKYVNDILIAFNDAGYFVDFTLLNASKMGVPQRRERVFFTAIRKDLYKGSFSDLFGTVPVIELEFNQDKINASEILNKEDGHSNGLLKRLWKITPIGKRPPGDSFFSYIKVDPNRSFPTLNGGSKQVTTTQMHPTIERYLNDKEMIGMQSFPTDYNFLGKRCGHLLAMSVPPVMMAQIATRIYDQWLTEMPDKGLTP